MFTLILGSIMNLFPLSIIVRVSDIVHESAIMPVPVVVPVSLVAPVPVVAPVSAATVRELLVFAGSAASVSFISQEEILNSGKSGLTERDIRLRIIIADEEACKRYAVHSGSFCIILIGKDGQEKFRSVKPVGLQKLFGLVDAMPMRKQEVKERKSSEHSGS